VWPGYGPEVTYPGQFLKLAVSGLGPETETWAWSLSLMPTSGGGTIASPPAVVPAPVIAAVRKFHESAIIATIARLDMIKLNVIGPDGRYANKSATVQHAFDQPVGGGGSDTYLPLQATAAVSLLTDASRGLASRGRFFLPYPRMLLTNGRMSATNQADMLSGATTLVNELNEALPGFRVCVASNTRAGAMRGVTRIGIGNRPDIIRSRGESLVESYALSAIESGGGGSF
jgi:hypothetical protein